jgi:cell division protein ZapA
VPEVNVDINGRKYRMACEEGQQPHLIALAERFNDQIGMLRQSVGEIGDGRLTVMAGIAVLDELGEAERRIAALESQVRELTDAGRALSGDLDSMEAAVAARLGKAAGKISALAKALDEAPIP